MRPSPSIRSLLLLVLVALSACTPVRHEVEGSLVARVRFEGNGGPLSGHNDYQLRAQMEQGASPFGALIWPLMYFVEGEGLERAALDRDAYRLEVWYAHNGWFDARFNGWGIRRIRNPGRRRADVVEVTGLIEPGEPSFFSSFEIEGMDRTSAIFGNTVKRTGYVQEGGQFNLESVYETRDQLIGVLREHSRAYATVAVDMTARPQSHDVAVVFRAEPGIAASFGEIHVDGQEAVPERVIRETLGFEPGQAYGVSDLAKAQRRLFDLGTFSVVSIQPDLSDPTLAEVPIHVKVLEARFKRVRAGGGLDYDGEEVTPRLSISFRHVDLFRRLLRLDTGASAGVAIPLDGDADTGEPIFHTWMDLSTPRVFGPDWTLALNGDVERNLQHGFAYLNPSAGLRLSWRPSEHVVLGFGPSWEFYQYLKLSDDGIDRVIAKALFGESFTNPYQLLTVDGRLTIDWRDDPIFTRRGSLFQVSVRHALPVPPGKSVEIERERLALGRDVVFHPEWQSGFHFSEITVDARTYRPIRLRRRAEDLPWSYAARLQGRALYDWTGRGHIPYPERIFMGGATDVRGFRGQQMGLYDVLCLYGADDAGSFVREPGAGQKVTRFELPRGGQFGASGTLELRYDWAYGVTWAVFSDVGMLADTWSDLRDPLSTLRVSGGVGARYKSLIGPIRMDLAFRPLYPEDVASGDFLGCFHADSTRRKFDLLSLGRWDWGDIPTEDPDDDPNATERRRVGWNPEKIPFAINLLFAIGQAL